MANAATARWYFAAGLDLKSAVATDLIPAATGKRLYIHKVWVGGVTGGTGGTGPHLRFGVSSAYTNAVNTESPVEVTANQVIDFIALAASTEPLGWLDIGSAPFGVKVNTASTHTTHTADIMVLATIVP